MVCDYVYPSSRVFESMIIFQVMFNRRITFQTASGESTEYSASDSQLPTVLLGEESRVEFSGPGSAFNNWELASRGDAKNVVPSSNMMVFAANPKPGQGIRETSW
jgi:hypothetical protein